MRQKKNIWKRVLEKRDARWAVSFLLFLAFIAFSADFIAGEYPILWKDSDGMRSPVMENYLGKVRYGSKYYLPNDFKGTDPDWAVWPLIRFGVSNLDREAGGFTRPFNERHLLGTDPVGRDVASGIIHGCRVSLTVGLLAVGLAFIFGVFIGMVPAFYGDDKLKVPVPELILSICWLPVGWFYAMQIYRAASGAGWLASLAGFLVALLLPYILFFAVTAVIRKRLPAGRHVAIPLDLIFMRLLEMFRSIPGLFIILTLLVWIEAPGLWVLAGLIALFFWPVFSRYVRGEFLRLRNLPFVKRFLLEGRSDLTIMAKYMLPNALTPLMVVMAFAMGSAIILESTLSFLGLGLPPDYVSWGSLMSDARMNVNAWWLAVFPGLAILLTVLSFNVIGRRLNEEMGEQLTIDN